MCKEVLKVVCGRGSFTPDWWAHGLDNDTNIGHSKNTETEGLLSMCASDKRAAIAYPPLLLSWSLATFRSMGCHSDHSRHNLPCISGWGMLLFHGLPRPESRSASPQRRRVALLQLPLGPGLRWSCRQCKALLCCNRRCAPLLCCCCTRHRCRLVWVLLRGAQLSRCLPRL